MIYLVGRNGKPLKVRNVITSDVRFGLARVGLTAFPISTKAVHQFYQFYDGKFDYKKKCSLNKFQLGVPNRELPTRLNYSTVYELIVRKVT